MMEDETRVFLSDTEAELRKVSASQFLSARKKGFDYAKESDVDMLTAAVVFWAEMIRFSAYDGEKPVYSSGEEVLSALSVGEIAALSGDIGLPEKITGIPGKMSVKEYSLAEEDEREDHPGEASRREALPVKRSLRSEGEEEERRVYADTESLDPTDGGRTVRDVPEVPDRTPDFSKMQEISDFFERDSRRYDGAWR